MKPRARAGARRAAAAPAKSPPRPPRWSTARSRRTSTERYPDAASMVADLEEVLALEASRSGQATGEVTTRAAHAAAARAPAAALADAPPRRAGPPRSRCSRRSSRSRSSLAARPDAPRHRRRARRARRAGLGSPSRSARPPRTTTTRSAPAPKTATASATSSTATRTPTWSTEHYYEGTLAEGRRRRPGRLPRRRPAACAARAIEIQTPTPGLRRADLRGRPHRPAAALRRHDAADRARLAGAARRERIACAAAHASACDPAGTRYRYYLIWLTTLPPGQRKSATIAEVDAVS